MNHVPDDPIRVEDTVLVLLAAGRSTRFGDIGSKLTEEFLNRPLGLHVAVALQRLPFAERLAIVDGARLDYAPYGFTQIHNDDPGGGMSRSVRLGVARAKEMGARAVMIALADMPRVTATHVLRVFDAADGDATVVASSDGRSPCPPALFGA
ncbi:MAG: nucleotidyltransferase family protein, partial [Sphingomonas sp.]